MSNLIKIHSYTRNKTDEKEKQKQKQFSISDLKPSKIYPKGIKSIPYITLKKDTEEAKSNTIVERKKKSLTPSTSKTKSRHTINCIITPNNPRFLPSLQSKSPIHLITQTDTLYRSKTPSRLKYTDIKSIPLHTNISKKRMNCTDNDFLKRDNSLLICNNTKELQIILSLKKKIKSQNDELKLKIEELAVLNKDKQFTSNKELHIENQVLNEEILKIKKMLLMTQNNNDLSKRDDLILNETKMQLDYLHKENNKFKSVIDDMRNQIAVNEDEKKILKNESKKQIEEWNKKENELKEKYEQMIQLKNEEHLNIIKAIEEEYNNKLKCNKENNDAQMLNMQNEFDNKLIVQQDEFNCELYLKLEESSCEINKLKSTIKDLETKVEEFQNVTRQLDSDEKKLNEVIPKKEEEDKILIIKKEQLEKQIEGYNHEESNKPQEIETNENHYQGTRIEIPTLISQDEINEISYLIRKTIQAYQLTQEELIKLISELPENFGIEFLAKKICLLSKSKHEKDYWTLVKYLFSLSLTDNNEISFLKLKKELQITLTTTQFRVIDEIADIVKSKANDLLSYCQKGDYCNKGIISYEQLCNVIQLLFAKENNAIDSIGKIKDYLIFKMKECPLQEASLYYLNYSIFQEMISSSQAQDKHKDKELKQPSQQQPNFTEVPSNVPIQEVNGLFMIENKSDKDHLLIDDIQEKNNKAPSPEELISGIQKYLNDKQISFDTLLLSINSKINIIGDSKWLPLLDFALLLKNDQIYSHCNDTSFEQVYLNKTKGMLNISTFSLLFSNEKDVNIELVEELPTEEYNIISREREDIILKSAIAREMEIRERQEEDFGNAQIEVNKEEEDVKKEKSIEIHDHSKDEVIEIKENEQVEKDDDDKKKEEERKEHQQLSQEIEKDQQNETEEIGDKKEEVQINKHEEVKVEDNPINNKKKKEKVDDSVEELVCTQVKDNNIEELGSERIKQEVTKNNTSLQMSEDNRDDIRVETKANDNVNDINIDQPQLMPKEKKKVNEKERKITMANIKIANDFISDIFNSIIQQKSANEYCAGTDIKMSSIEDNTNDNIPIDYNENEKENGANEKEESFYEHERPLKNENGSALYD